MTEEIIYYECGNWGDEQECPLCGSDLEDPQPTAHDSKLITCEGWNTDD